MNNALVTGGVAVTSGSVAGLIQWIFTGFGHPVPADVMPLLVGGAVAAGHVAQMAIKAKFGAVVAAPIAVPAAPAA